MSLKPTRTEIENLLQTYRGEVGAGKMDRAAFTMLKAVELLLDVVYSEEATDIVNAANFFVTQPDEQLPLPLGGVCAPCDVTQPDNPALIKEFTKEIVAPDGTVLGTSIVDVDAIEHAKENGIDLQKEVDAASARLVEMYEESKTVVDESNGTVTRNGITEPIIEHHPSEAFDFGDVPADREIGEAYIDAVTPPHVETALAAKESVAPAPKTPKKQKPKAG